MGSFFPEQSGGITMRTVMTAFAAGIATLLLLGSGAVPSEVMAQPTSPPGLQPFSIEAFQTDLFTGTSTLQIPIAVPSGAASVAPRIALRYSSGAVDELQPWEQGGFAGLGWTLDTGGFILRDTKNTTTTTDDTFKLVLDGAGYDLVLIDAAQNIYHTADETFVKLQYTSSGDYWTLTTK